MSPSATASPSATTTAANAFVAAHLAEATDLGTRLGLDVGEPDAFVRTARMGFAALADPAYRQGQITIAPGIDPAEIVGVRLPLMEAVHRAYKKATRETSTAQLLDVIARLLTSDDIELRWLGIWDLSRCLATDPERTWQLMRAAAARAREWISVDMLAHPFGEGILLEPRRWSELDRLKYSTNRWERRLVGSTLATIPFAKGMPGGRDPETAARGLAAIADLIGDEEPDVQKALSWALRNFAAVDQAAVVAFLEREAATARADDDGNRAWVVRDSLSKIPAATAATLKANLEGVRRRSNAPSTSRAAAAAAQLIREG
jgi:3-methyladenine DNA glycosylase AlkD